MGNNAKSEKSAPSKRVSSNIEVDHKSIGSNTLAQANRQAMRASLAVTVLTIVELG
jgi:hypothetical protein